MTLLSLRLIWNTAALVWFNSSYAFSFIGTSCPGYDETCSKNIGEYKCFEIYIVF